MPRETILIDADDTLWENNVFFEQTIEEFLTLLEPFGYVRDYARHILNETERRNIRQHGYGVRSFRRPLEDTYTQPTGHRAERATRAGMHFRCGGTGRRPPSTLRGGSDAPDDLPEEH